MLCTPLSTLMIMSFWEKKSFLLFESCQHNKKNEERKKKRLRIVAHQMSYKPIYIPRYSWSPFTTNQIIRMEKRNCYYFKKLRNNSHLMNCNWRKLKSMSCLLGRIGPLNSEDYSSFSFLANYYKMFLFSNNFYK